MDHSFENYHHLGMEHFDGGQDRWDFDHDGKMSIFEESARRSFDQIMFENIFGEEENRSSDDWDEEDSDDWDDNDGDAGDWGDDSGDDFGEDF